MSCHGQRMEGSPFGPTLIGPGFMNKWRGKQAAELLTQMRNTMPPKGTGISVDPQAMPDVLALLVRANLQGLPTVAVAPCRTSVPREAPRVRIPEPLPANLAQRLSSLTPVSEAMLAAPPEGDWLMWRRTFDAAGYSPLRQIDRGNVQRLRQAWTPAAGSPAPTRSRRWCTTACCSCSAATWCWPSTARAARRCGATSMATRTASAARGGDRMKSMALHGHALLVATPDGRVRGAGCAQRQAAVESRPSPASRRAPA